MVVGPFALIGGLRPLLERTGGARVISVTSGGMYTQALPLDDLGYASGAFSGPRAYARAKRAQTALVREWARRLAAAGSDVTINAMHPGWADTPGLADTLPGFYRFMGPLLRTPAEGADTIVWLASDAAAAGRRPGGCSSTGDRGRSTASRPRACPPRTDERYGDLVVGLSGEPDPAQAG